MSEAEVGRGHRCKLQPCWLPVIIGAVLLAAANPFSLLDPPPPRPQRFARDNIYTYVVILLVLFREVGTVDQSLEKEILFVLFGKLAYTDILIFFTQRHS